jgi:hypothetical protein
MKFITHYYNEICFVAAPDKSGAGLYCWKNSVAYDVDKLPDFYDGFTFVSKAYNDVRLHIDGCLDANAWHGHIVPLPGW